MLLLVLERCKKWLCFSAAILILSGWLAASHAQEAQGTMVFSQQSSDCTSSDGRPGQCINIRACEPLLQVLREARTNPASVQLLRNSVCGGSSSDPMVCCPYNTGNVPTGNQPSEGSHSFGNEATPDPSGFSDIQITSAPFPDPPPVVLPDDPTFGTTPSSGGTRSYPECGETAANLTRIVGGRLVEKGQFPWAAALGYQSQLAPGTTKWLCGGSLITNRHVLTAAHCVFNRNDLYIVRLGVIDISGASEPPTDVLIAEKIPHENFNPTQIQNDIAILKLAGSVNRPIIPVCLPSTPELVSNKFEGILAFVTGWGSIYFNGPSTKDLMLLQIPTVVNAKCREAYRTFQGAVIDDRVLCAGFADGGKDACQGDSGGPLMVPRLEPGASTKVTFYLIGVVSYGFRCAEPGYPGVYTRVTEFLDWINSHLS